MSPLDLLALTFAPAWLARLWYEAAVSQVGRTITDLADNAGYDQVPERGTWAPTIVGTRRAI